MKKVSDADRLYYFEKNFFTMDGLWMLEVEKEVGWDVALEIDKNVWINLMKIIFRRIKKYLNIETNNLNDLIEIITFRWSIEGWKYIVNRVSETEVIIEITECPYKAIMDRNPNRRDRIPLICKNMCFPFYKAAFRDFNPKILFERNMFMGLGDKKCDFCFKIIEEKTL
ncbi:MAG: L-2-amino-thiazoline-4-carboxylic acid hydrolase [Promethearchaeota archaeon]|nr:MAG: L-2-amino-thiazoline-4-carboxylic acid hydrolase [Candidatus Lokiarchaeota archaeon]